MNFEEMSTRLQDLPEDGGVSDSSCCTEDALQPSAGFRADAIAEPRPLWRQKPLVLTFVAVMALGCVAFASMLPSPKGSARTRIGSKFNDVVSFLGVRPTPTVSPSKPGCFLAADAPMGTKQLTAVFNDLGAAEWILIGDDEATGERRRIVAFDPLRIDLALTKAWPAGTRCDPYNKPALPTGPPQTTGPAKPTPNWFLWYNTPAPTSFSPTVTPFNCLGNTNFYGWSTAKINYCCATMNIACSTTTSTTTSGTTTTSTTTTTTTTTSTTTTTPFDCYNGRNANWMSGWSLEKKNYCCVLTPQCPTSTTTTTTTTTEPFDCSLFNQNWMTAWSDAKKNYCCVLTNKCPTSTTSTSTSTTFTTNTTTSTTTTTPFDCAYAVGNWEAAWSQMKKDWCCTHDRCPTTATTTTTTTTLWWTTTLALTTSAKAQTTTATQLPLTITSAMVQTTAATQLPTTTISR